MICPECCKENCEEHCSREALRKEQGILRVMISDLEGKLRDMDFRWSRALYEHLNIIRGFEQEIIKIKTRKKRTPKIPLDSDSSHHSSVERKEED